MKLVDLLEVSQVEPLKREAKETYRKFNVVKKDMSDSDGEAWDELADKFEYALDQGDVPDADRWLDRLRDLISKYHD